MNQYKDDINIEGLKFFGKVSASISHELKNAIAIINENAGLLSDLALMTEKGIPLDPERMKKLAGTIQKQIERSDGILKNMNRFAHSVDKYFQKINLVETVALIISLSDRPAKMKGLVFHADSSETPVFVKTSPFLLENLIWIFLELIIGSIGKGKEMNILINKIEGGAIIKFVGIKDLSNEELKGFNSEIVKAQALLLKAVTNINPDRGEISITLPDELENNN